MGDDGFNQTAENVLYDIIEEQGCRDETEFIVWKRQKRNNHELKGRSREQRWRGSVKTTRSTHYTKMRVEQMKR